MADEQQGSDELQGTDAAQLTAWLRDELGLDPASTVDVTEKPGTDPRCSPVVTQVTITSPGEAAYSFHIEHPLHEVTQMDVVAALAFGGGH